MGLCLAMLRYVHFCKLISNRWLSGLLLLIATNNRQTALVKTYELASVYHWFLLRKVDENAGKLIWPVMQNIYFAHFHLEFDVITIQRIDQENIYGFYTRNFRGPLAKLFIADCMRCLVVRPVSRLVTAKNYGRSKSPKRKRNESQIYHWFTVNKKNKQVFSSWDCSCFQYEAFWISHSSGSSSMGSRGDCDFGVDHDGGGGVLIVVLFSPIINIIIRR